MKLFFIVGEDSGDALAAPLIKALKAVQGDNVECMGIGGPLMKATEGFSELLPMDQISIIGIWEVLPKIPRLIKIRKAIVEEIEKQQPDAVITVDFPDFNFIIAKSLKNRGIYKGKLIHYVAPSVWAWRPKRAEKIAQFLDGMMCLFPMEVPFFTEHGMKAAHVGHPVVTTNALNADPEIFRDANNIPENAKTIGLFFGSREIEFKKLSPIIKEAAMLIDDVEDNLHIISPTLPHIEYNIRKLLQDFKLPVYVTSNPLVKWEAFKSCDVAVAVSGTVALELAYCGVPHILVYKTNPITALILRFMLKTKHVHLANILLEDEVVPEMLQGKCRSDVIAETTLELLDNDDLRQTQLDKFKALEPLLSGEGDMTPSERAADFVLTVIQSPPKQPQEKTKPDNA